jgi:ABC-type cobalamin transport system ATPase subunit
LHAIALSELGALDGVSAMQEHRADMLQDILVGLCEEARQILDLNHQTRKTLRHARKPKAMPLGRKDRRGRQIQGVRPLPVERRD